MILHYIILYEITRHCIILYDVYYITCYSVWIMGSLADPRCGASQASLETLCRQVLECGDAARSTPTKDARGTYPPRVPAKAGGSLPFQGDSGSITLEPRT